MNREKSFCTASRSIPTIRRTRIATDPAPVRSINPSSNVETGKSTSLRAATARLHPTQYLIVIVVASSGSVLDFLKGLALSLGAPEVSSSTSKLIRDIRQLLSTVTAKKQHPVIVIDETHLLRLELLAQLHARTQLPFDQSALAPIILSGRNVLVDRLLFHTSRPFASRIIGRTLLQGLQREDMYNYLCHHLSIVGGSEIFSSACAYREPNTFPHASFSCILESSFICDFVLFQCET